MQTAGSPGARRSHTPYGYVSMHFCSQPLCVCVIKEVVKIADSKLVLSPQDPKEQDFIVGEQQGNWIIYSITDRGRQALKCTERLEK